MFAIDRYISRRGRPHVLTLRRTLLVAHAKLSTELLAHVLHDDLGA